MADIIKECLNWINRQPEMQDGWLSYGARTMLLRLWKERDDTVAALNERIRRLESGAVLPVVQLHDGDKLIVNTTMPLTHDQRRVLVEAFADALDDPKRRAVVFDRCSLFVLRGANGQSPTLEAVADLLDEKRITV